jgi:glutaredoxin 3
MFYIRPMNSRPILYVKSGCPWCHDALSFFQRSGLDLEVKDVTRDGEAMKRMREISGQSLTPTFEYKDFIVADFSVNEFEAAVKKRPEIGQELKLKTN